MSVNAHLGVEQSRRDDLEALGYLLTYFFRGGKLPWMGFHIENTRERFRKIGQCKQLINIHKFCKDMPREFAIYFRYIKTLRFSETPDYNYLRTLLRNCLYQRDLIEDNLFDWITMKTTAPISPYSEHPPKAAKFLGTSDSVSYQDRTSPGLHNNRQYQEEVQHLKVKPSKSWSIDSSTVLETQTKDKTDENEDGEVEKEQENDDQVQDNENDTKTSVSSSMITIKKKENEETSIDDDKTDDESIKSKKDEQENEEDGQEKTPEVHVNQCSCFPYLQRFKLNK